MREGGATPGPGLTSAFPLPPTDYSTHHISQFFRSNYVFLFQLPWLPEKLLSMSDFQVQWGKGLGVRGGWGAGTGQAGH